MYTLVTTFMKTCTFLKTVLFQIKGLFYFLIACNPLPHFTFNFSSYFYLCFKLFYILIKHKKQYIRVYLSVALL